jgi:hypothetical protein
VYNAHSHQAHTNSRWANKIARRFRAQISGRRKIVHAVALGNSG